MTDTHQPLAFAESLYLHISILGTVLLLLPCCLVSCLTIAYLPIFKQSQAAMANQSMEIITKVLEQSAKLVEEQVDAQLAKLNEIDEDDLERLKERRLEALKKAQKQKQVCGTFYNHCSILLC